MKFLKRIMSLFYSAPRSRDNSYWFYVQCDKCGEIIRGRVNMMNDISPRYADVDGAEGYYTRKVLIGENLCFQKIEVELEFNKQYQLLNREITGGKFITEEEYNAAGKSAPNA